ncbi:Potassium transporter 13 [Hibiscus syriacus]|uniref:Potassium transporter 13 n=1 Tax=Hibiscus syriacus TaxID=106335 RepID=A0A6A2WCD3_HIBSY|nr:Potassium transporter 13 [Hibiscus syriacus]
MLLRNLMWTLEGAPLEIRLPMWCHVNISTGRRASGNAPSVHLSKGAFQMTRLIRKDATLVFLYLTCSFLFWLAIFGGRKRHLFGTRNFLGYPQTSYGLESRTYAPQYSYASRQYYPPSKPRPQYYPPPQPEPQYYMPSQDRGSDKKRLQRRYSRIADNYNSLDQVTEALANAGLESSNLIVGIDFTKSNEWTASTHDQDVFSFYPDEIFCNGFEEDLSHYKELVPHLRLAGPTSFAPIIEMAMTIVEKSSGQYHVLVIIADGQVTRSVDTQRGQLSPQEQKTVDAIVQASKLPLSIVLVGVGDGPWDMMEFDDNIPVRAGGGSSSDRGGGGEIRRAVGSGSMDSLESRWVFPGEDEYEIEDEEDNTDVSYGAGVDFEDEDSSVQSLIRTKPRVDSFDAEALEVHGAYRSNYEDFGIGRIIIHAFHTLGVVFGDVGTSPLYTFSVMFSKAPINEDEDVIGELSLVLYNLLVIPLVKYVLIILWANDDGEDTRISGFMLKVLSPELERSLKIKERLESPLTLNKLLLMLVLAGTSMVIADRVVTPAMSVMSSVGGQRLELVQLNKVTVIPCCYQLYKTLLLC